jgi:type IV secretion system protein VirB4
MSVDVSQLLFTPSTVGSLLLGAGALASAVAGVTLMVPKISRKLMPLPKETKKGDLVQILKVAGAELQVTNENEHLSLFTARRTWLGQIAERKARARVFTVRTAIKPGQLVSHPIPHMAKLAKDWEQSFERASFHTDHYIVLSVDKAAGRVALEEAVSLSLAALTPFKAEVLTAEKGESPLKILGRLASPISRPSPKYQPNANVSEQITSDTVEFADDKSGLITWNSGTRQRFMAIIGIKAWGDYTEEKMLADLASLNFEYVIYHHIDALHRTKAMTTMDMSYRLARTTLMTETAQEQFATVSEIIAGGAEDSQILCNYSLNLLVEAPTVEELDRRISQINTIAAQYEVTTIREGAVSQSVWWSMFPTYDTIARPWKPLAANVATLLAMQRNHKGASFSPWGNSPVTILKTATGSPYSFVFHDMSDPGNKEPLGHMLVIGPSGSGKTVTVSWLAMMAMRYPELRVFFFDRFYGTEVVTRMAGGHYVRFDDDSCAMNPLQMDLTPRNRDFLATWLKLITGLTDDQSSEQFGMALDMMSILPPEQRNLKKVWNTAFPPDAEARARIRPWISDNQHGHVFCAEKDSLDLGSRMTSFDFTNVLNDERTDNLGPAVVSYIMHRTMDVSVNQGYPALYFVDETAPLLRNEFFAAKFAAGLQEGRKLGQIFICAFQRPNAIEETPHAQTIIGQCATQIFFRNVKAKEEDFKIFGLTARELDFVLGRSHNHMRRAFLLRRMSETDGVESVIIDADMGPLGVGLQTFASGNASVRLIRELAQKDPENFRQLYMDRAAAERQAA